jgi:hypothetical protein
MAAAAATTNEGLMMISSWLDRAQKAASYHRV